MARVPHPEENQQGTYNWEYEFLTEEQNMRNGAQLLLNYLSLSEIGQDVYPITYPVLPGRA